MPNQGGLIKQEAGAISGIYCPLILMLIRLGFDNMSFFAVQIALQLVSSLTLIYTDVILCKMKFLTFY